MSLEYEILKSNKDICILLDRYMDARTEKFGLTFAQSGMLLYVLNEKNGTDTADLNKEFSISKSTVSSILKKLCSKGFITLESHKTDNRRKRIIPTQKAFRVKNGLIREFELVQDELFSGLSEKELNSLQEFQKNILCNAKQNFKKYIETEE